MKPARPVPLAVALAWDGDAPPRVTAQGYGDVAGRIVALAREHDVHLENNPELARLLAQVDLGEVIPPALFVAVAEVIAYAYAMSGEPLPRPAQGTRTQR